MPWEQNDDLERAFANAHLGLEETVEFFRLLRESNLTFTAPYPPEMEGQHKVGSDGKMIITVWTVGGEEVVPIFTSPGRLDEAVGASLKQGQRYLAGQMQGKELFKAFVPPHNKLRVAINPLCQCGTRFLDPKLVQSIVDGSALYLPTPGSMAMNGLVISLPDRQPAQLREPLGKFFATLPEVKAAWLFYEEEPKKPHEQVYVVGLMVEGGEAEELKREAALAIAGACPPEWGSRALIMDAKDPGYNDVMHGVPPFYKTADFQPPAELPDGKV
jgi:hypothetical protein